MKWIIGIVVALIIGFGVYQWKQGDDLDAPGTVSGQIKPTQYAPADTIYFSASHTTPQLAEFFADYFILGTPGGQAKMLHMAVEATKDKDEPSTAFAHYLLTKFQAERDGSLQSFLDFFSLSPTGDLVFFSHGLMPVIKLPLASKEKLEALLTDAAASSGLENTQEDLDGRTVHLWALNDKSGEDAIYLALLAEAPYATLTIIKGSDAVELRKERLGITLPQRSLADTDEVEEMEKTFQLKSGNSGFIHFERIAAAFITPENSLLGRELKTLLNESASPEMESKLTPECTKEYAELASAMPRLVAGYRKLAIEHDELVMDFAANLEVTSALVKNELAKVRGHVSQHVLQSEEQILGVGYGLNVDQIAPALTALWTDFTQRQFQCESLVAAQTKAREFSPMMLGAVFGMAQGIKGVGFSLYDVEFTEGPVPSSMSALLTIAAENPSAVAALAAMAPLPELAGLHIPADGTPVRIPVAMLPPTIELYAAIKGKHLTIYLGDQAAAASETLTDQTIEPNGFFGLSMNYDKITELVESVNISDFSMMGAMAGSTADCAAQFDMLDSFSGVSGDFSFVSDLDNNGFDFSMRGKMAKPQYDTHTISGSYRAETMDDLCQWQPAGVDTFTLDGSGTFEQKSFSGDCVIRDETYTWNQLGARVNTETTRVRNRETCQDEFSVEDQTTGPDICFILQSSEDGFICHYNPLQEDSYITRYSKVEATAQ